MFSEVSKGMIGEKKVTTSYRSWYFVDSSIVLFMIQKLRFWILDKTLKALWDG